MEQFSLEKYLENPSRKITTRYGDREVRIICTNRKGKYPIVALMVDTDDGSEYITSHSINGWIDGKEKYPDKRDLFFADEEEELTKFEIEILNLLNCAIPEGHGAPTIEKTKEYSQELLDLAKKELRKEQQEKLGTLEMPIDVTEPYYIKGREDALKDLPKWKKAKKDEELECHVAIQQDDRVVLSDFVQKDEYYITLNVLKTLPKEE